MAERASISSEILARYARDAALEVAGVTGIVDRPLQRQRGVRIHEADDRIAVELHVAVAWGSSLPAVGGEIQERVARYLTRMADVEPAAVNVVVDEIGPP